MYKQETYVNHHKITNVSKFSRGEIMNQYISSYYPNLIFSNVESAKDFAEKLGFEEYEVVEYIYLSDDEKQATLIGYAILKKGILFQ